DVFRPDQRVEPGAGVRVGRIERVDVQADPRRDTQVLGDERSQRLGRRVGGSAYCGVQGRNAVRARLPRRQLAAVFELVYVRVSVGVQEQSGTGADLDEAERAPRARLRPAESRKKLRRPQCLVGVGLAGGQHVFDPLAVLKHEAGEGLRQRGVRGPSAAQRRVVRGKFAVGFVEQRAVYGREEQV